MPTADMIALARLHAALDSTIETEQLITALRSSPAGTEPTVGRVAVLVSETRELLRWLLTRREPVL